MINDNVIAVVVPAFNVEKQIADAVKGLASEVDLIVVVDDESKDNTIAAIKKINDERIHLISNRENLGVGGATKEGFKLGLELGADICIKYDGDGQMDPTKLKDLVKPLFDGYDYAKGNRFIHTDALSQMPKIRLLGNFLLTFMTKLVSGYWNIFDPQNGYVAITRKWLGLLPFENIHNRYFFENDMLIRLNVLGARVRDVSMPSRYGDEKSSLKVSKILISFPWLFIKRFVQRVYTKYVLYDFSVIGLFYFLGAFFMLFGTCFGAYHWVKSIHTGVVATTGTVMIAVLPIIIGFQLFLQAIVMEINDCNRRHGK